MHFRLHLLLFVAVTTNQSIHSLKQNNISFENTTEFADNPIISIQKIQDNDKIKRNLDKFTMKHRKTHFDIPGGEMLDINESKHNIIHKSDVYQQFYKFGDPGNSYFYKDPKLFTIMRKQTVLMTKLLDYLEREKQAKRSGKKNDFDTLMHELEMKEYIGSHEDFTKAAMDANNNRITITTTKDTTKKISTILTLIDETEVRKALKNDPYVSRILKLAGRKRDKYFRSIGNI